MYAFDLPPLRAPRPPKARSGRNESVQKVQSVGATADDVARAIKELKRRMNEETRQRVDASILREQVNEQRRAENGKIPTVASSAKATAGTLPTGTLSHRKVLYSTKTRTKLMPSPSFDAQNRRPSDSGISEAQRRRFEASAAMWTPQKHLDSGVSLRMAPESRVRSRRFGTASATPETAKNTVSRVGFFGLPSYASSLSDARVCAASLSAQRASFRNPSPLRPLHAHSASKKSAGRTRHGRSTAETIHSTTGGKRRKALQAVPSIGKTSTARHRASQQSSLATSQKEKGVRLPRKEEKRVPREELEGEVASISPITPPSPFLGEALRHPRFPTPTVVRRDLFQGDFLDVDSDDRRDKKELLREKSERRFKETGTWSPAQSLLQQLAVAQ